MTTMAFVHGEKEKMRLIDADKLVALLNKKYGDDENINESVLYLVGAISGATTVDAVEVVRCKDCAYWGTKVVYANGERADCLNFNFVTPCDFFCKWGERREDEQQE